MPEVALGEKLHRDVHPAEVAIAGHLLTGVRVFVTSERLLAYRARADGSIERVLAERLEQPCSVPPSRASLPANGRLEARLADGRTAWINRGQGCGCGSPLKALAAPVTWTGG